MNILDIVNSIKKLNDCIVYPVENLPIIQPGHLLPKDLAEFYRVCGGTKLFVDSPFPTFIVSPNKFTQANPIIFSRMEPKELDKTRSDISWSWYLIGIGPNSQYITIDLDPARLGNCYDSFWDRHPRDSYIISFSFVELLTGLLTTKGEYYFWDTEDFVPLGDPYHNK